MSESRCPYLRCVTTAMRESLDLRVEAQMDITRTWYCRHPFHGITLELGDARREMEKHCAACTLPRQQRDEATD